MREKDSFANKNDEWHSVSAMTTMHRLTSFENVNVLYEKEDTYRKMLKEPRPEDVRRNFRKDTSFLLVFLSWRIVIFLARALAATNARVTRVTCNKKRTKIITCCLINVNLNPLFHIYVVEKQVYFHIFHVFLKSFYIMNIVHLLLKKYTLDQFA